MAEECFQWAREAKAKEVRVSLLQLAQVWLDAASKLDGLPPSRTAPVQQEASKTALGDNNAQPAEQSTVIAITLLKKRSPGHLRPGPISTPVSAVRFGDKRPWCQTRSAGFRTRTMHHRPMPRM
jgi:hypothetical protein